LVKSIRAIPARTKKYQMALSSLLRAKARGRWPLIVFLVTLIGLFGYVYRGLFPWEMVAVGDLQPWPLAPGDAFDRFRYTWFQGWLGYFNPLLPIIFVIHTTLTWLTGGDASLAQGIFQLLLLPLSAITMYILLRRFINSSVGRVLISLVYAVNGITIVYFQIGGHPILFPYALFPLLMLYWLKVIEEERGRLVNSLMFALILGLIASYMIYQLYLVVPFLVLFLLSQVLVKRNFRWSIRTILLFLGSLGVVFFLLMPTSWDMVLNIAGFFTGGGGGEFGFYKATPIEEQIRALARVYSYEWSLRSFSNFTYLLIPLTLGILLVPRQRRGYYIALAIITASSLISGRLLATGHLLDLFRKFPMLLPFRDPIKLMVMMAWSSFLMMALLFDLVIAKLASIKWYQLRFPIYLVLSGAIIWASLFVVISEAHPPFADAGNNLSRFFTKGLEPEVADIGKVPAVFTEVHQWLEPKRQTEGFFRTLWLPLERLTANKILPTYDPPTFWWPADPNHTLFVMSPLLAGQTQEFGEILGHLNVKYVIVNLESWEHEYLQTLYTGPPRFLYQGIYGYATVGAPEEYVKLLGEQKDLRIVAEEENFIIYENLDFTPLITAYSEVFLTAPESLLAGRSGYRLMNSSFNNELESWALSAIPGVQYTIDQEVYHSGPSSLRMDVQYIPGIRADIYQVVTGESKMVYDLTAWVKAENTTAATFKVYFFDDVGNGIVLADGSGYLRSWFQASTEWKRIEAEIATPPGTAQMRIHFATGHDWSFMDKSKPAKVWVDDFILSQRPFGLIVTDVADAFSGIRSFASSEPLLVYGDYLGSGQTAEDYLEISKRVIFIGDAEPSATDKEWFIQSDNLLFLYEAETSLDSIWVREVSPIVVADDSQATLWTGNVAQVGSIGPAQLSNDATQKVSGSDSLKIIVGSGEGARWTLRSDLATRQDWSTEDSLNFYWYGANTNATIRFIAAPAYPTADSLHYFYSSFKDDFLGWKQIILLFDDFQFAGEPSWNNIAYLHFQVNENDIQGTWYLDRMTIDVDLLGGYDIAEGSSFSKGTALSLKGSWQVEQQFFAPRTGYYRVLIRAALDGEITLRLNDKLVDIARVIPDVGELKGYEFNSILLEEGEHTLSIEAEQVTAILDQVTILAANGPDVSFEDVFSTKSVELDWEEENPTKYLVRVNSDSPTIVVLGQAFHKDWQAYTDGEKLQHISALPFGWANGFYLSQGGEHQVEIVFEKQKGRDIALIIWAVAWSSLVLAIAGIWGLHCYRRSQR